MSAAVAAVLAATGMYLLVTANRPGGAARRAPFEGTTRRRRRSARHQWLVQAGLAEVALGEFCGVVVVLALLGGALGVALFGSPLPAAVAALAAATTPIGMYRNRRRVRRERGAQEWPRLIEELRVRATTLGRSLPQALFEVGASAPAPLRPAFEAAQREWLISTDFASTLGVMKAQLADPTADLVCETLLIAHELGGTDLGPRLQALAEDRQLDITSRKDALAKQAGVRFARRFVLIVPLGMAAAGSMIGTGRRAYGTDMGQLMVVGAMALMAVCWWWAGRFLRLPEARRVFAETAPADAIATRGGAVWASLAGRSGGLGDRFGGGAGGGLGGGLDERRGRR